MRSERVLVVEAIHDEVPVSGLAEIDGAVWLFERVFSEEKDDYADECQMWLSGSELLRLMLGNYDRFRRWLAAGMPPTGRVPALAVELADAEAAQMRIDEIRKHLGPPQLRRLHFIRPEVRVAGHEGWRVALGT